MAAVADWHGRVTVPHLDLRGDVKGACARLEAVLRDFDSEKASKPPFTIPDWARGFFAENGAGAVAAFLERVHPRKGGRPDRRRKFEDLRDLYESLDVEPDLIALSSNLIEACGRRTPPYGQDFPGYAEEAALLRTVTYCRNDRVKFKAIRGWAAFAPVSEIAFLVKRAEERRLECRNPNVVLCNSMAAIGEMARRFPGATDRRSVEDRSEILGVLPALVEVLDTEARNNGACRLTSESIVAIIEATGAPEALEAYLHNLSSPKPDSDWMRERTDRYHATALKWLQDHTQQDPGTDYPTLMRWYAANRTRLYYHPKRKLFLIDRPAAERYRRHLTAASRR